MVSKISSVIDVILMFFLIISTNSIYVNIEDAYNFNNYITILILVSFKLFYLKFLRKYLIRF